MKIQVYGIMKRERVECPCSHARRRTELIQFSQQRNTSNQSGRGSSASTFRLFLAQKFHVEEICSWALVGVKDTDS